MYTKPITVITFGDEEETFHSSFTNTFIVYYSFLV